MNAKPTDTPRPNFGMATEFSSRLSALAVQRSSPPDTVPAELLFRGHQEILIGHNGDTYRLRITRNGKLILTK